MPTLCSQTMRKASLRTSRVLVCFLAALAVLAVLAGAGASAEAGTQMFSASDTSTPATPTLAFTTAKTVPYPLGKRAILQGVLKGGATVASQTILLEALDDAGTSWVAEETCVTNSSGHFAWFVDPRERTTYHAKLVADPTITSASAVVLPHPNVIWFAGESRTTKRNLMWYAALTYKTTGASGSARYRVVIDRWLHGKWKRQESWWGTPQIIPFKPEPAAIYEYGSPFIMHKFKKRGSWRVRVEFRASSTLGASQSKWLHVKVK